MVKRLCIALALCMAGPPALAGEIPTLTRHDLVTINDMFRAAQGRPNELFRLAGLKAYVRRDYADAREKFEAAALHADKYSQHVLSLMHWHGVGAPADRVQAYVWADVAAERGTRTLLLVRERMWSQLSAEERARAQALGEDVYARYGDDVAKPKAEGAMRLFASRMTGSRVGFIRGRLDILPPPASGTYSLPGSNTATLYGSSTAVTAETLYEGDRRDLAAYWKGQDRALTGTGRASGLQDVRTDPR